MNERSESAVAAERRRATTYSLLAALFQPPDDVGLDALAETDESDVSIAVSPLADAAADANELTLDHAGLFVGPFELEAPPYESVYVDSETQVMTESTAQVQAEYNEAGVDIDLDEPADHVAAELEFTFLLVATEIEALEAGEFDAAEHYLERQYEFLSEHLGRWISELAENMREHADTEFYSMLADEAQSFVEGDGKRLADRLNRLDATDDDLATVLEDGDTNDS
ncbi:TorD/DmsD family molecular chaperone [Natranaeroarchaeum aerophilus]|uniref:Molecular chaperone TorD family protein n=1 Tax=Natranaeroarchaeum aerophilus TaxID=2917711 RepID=A0AAE3K403_9EURY|nr:molecular chaperone TorD family protein [Natranaeroarchaeum aerophilus]MCL9812215.1 molecular chaperone TorD family protein [Natranaeroarchaeum aerophilus]